jgi:hypothetical protein
MITHTDTTTMLHLPPIVHADRELILSERPMGKDTRRSGRMSPTESEVLELSRDLGYAGGTSDDLPAAPPCVRINAGDGLVDPIKGILARLGGTPSGPGMTPSYQFDSQAARTVALDAVRSRFGWTSVDPAW